MSEQKDTKRNIRVNVHTRPPPIIFETGVYPSRQVPGTLSVNLTTVPTYDTYNIFPQSSGLYLPRQTFGDYLNVLTDDYRYNRVMSGLFNNIMARRVEEKMDEELMASVMEESLAYYKTQEKKPNIKLGIKIHKWKEAYKDEACVICKCDCVETDSIVEAPCKHFFHEDCIAEWVKYKSECPVCREKIPTYDEKDKQEESKETEDSDLPVLLDDIEVKKE